MPDHNLENKRRDAVTITMVVLFIAGLGLMALNVAGLMLPLRSPRVGDPALFFFPDDVTITLKEFWDAVERPGGGDGDTAIRLTMTVNQAILHYWDEDDAGAIPLGVPPWENYWLWGASFLHRETYRKYEFLNLEKAVERGVGLCSQQALILEQLLEQHGISAEIVGLDGHVVVAARIKWDTVDSAEWLLDPDYGVAIPHSLAEVEGDPELIRQSYSERGYSTDQIDTLAGIYGQAGNRRYASYREGNEFKYKVERTSYVAKWAIPLVMMLPWGQQYFRRKTRGKHIDQR